MNRNVTMTAILSGMLVFVFCFTGCDNLGNGNPAHEKGEISWVTVTLPKAGTRSAGDLISQTYQLTVTKAGVQVFENTFPAG